MILGLVVGSIRSLVLERGKEKLAARLVEKKRERVLRKISDSDSNVKVSHFTKAVTLGGETEGRRRRNEFKLMRKIQDRAAARRKWTSLLLSIFAWLVLWFVGAAVFWVAERKHQPMSYFETMYFSYTSLLTIGYGDYTLLSNSGKAAFVFWSLCAVPTLTILISNMGDTVIRNIRDLTLYLGAFTVLPGEDSATRKVKTLAKRAAPGKQADEEVALAKNRTEKSPSLTKGSPPATSSLDEYRNIEKSDKSHPEPTPQSATTRANGHLDNAFEQEELGEIEQAKRSGDPFSENTHHYHYLLLKEIRKVMKDVGEDPPKKYGYGEWAWFMRLLGEDENDGQFHRKPMSASPKKDEMQTAGFSGGKTKSGGRSDQGRSQAESTEESTSWSWLGARSPLMGDSTEAEWVLERLSQRLEGQLRAERDKEREQRKKRGELGDRHGLEGLKSPATILEESKEASFADDNGKWERMD